MKAGASPAFFLCAALLPLAPVLWIFAIDAGHQHRRPRQRRTLAALRAPQQVAALGHCDVIPPAFDLRGVDPRDPRAGAVHFEKLTGAPEMAERCSANGR